jgi:hypothetical protein
MRYWQIYAVFGAAALLIALFGSGVLKGTNPPPAPPGPGTEHDRRDPRTYRVPDAGGPAPTR